jgi:hypothetical protein
VTRWSPLLPLSRIRVVARMVRLGRHPAKPRSGCASAIWGTELLGFSSPVRHRPFSGRVSNPPLHYLNVAMDEDDHALEHVAGLGEIPASAPRVARRRYIPERSRRRPSGNSRRSAAARSPGSWHPRPPSTWPSSCLPCAILVWLEAALHLLGLQPTRVNLSFTVHSGTTRAIGGRTASILRLSRNGRMETHCLAGHVRLEVRRETGKE